MAPPRIATKPTQSSILMRSGITTRNKSAQLNGLLAAKPAPTLEDVKRKRKADMSPLKDKTVKRSALGNITNALSKSSIPQLQVPEKKKTITKTVHPTLTKLKTESENKTIKTTEILTNADKRVQAETQNKLKAPLRIKQIKEEDKKVAATKTSSVTRRSVENLEKSEDSSLYVSALEDISEETDKIQTGDSNNIVESIKDSKKEIDEPKPEAKRQNLPPVRKLPKGVLWDFDAENWQDPYQVSPYAQEIFEYLKERESAFPISDYMDKQMCLSKWMRSMLVDWMVEIQESFELNHETLYLAVKLVDLYLTKVSVGKEMLQLLGAAALFIASKYDERIPPMVEDFLYICDGAYSQRELIKMEINVLKVMDFDIGVPLSYRFLRRYARCAKITMPTLTLARYILEYSLMDYDVIRFSDSKMAAAALYLALYMKDISGWTPTLEYYSGYKLEDFKHIVLLLNEGLHRKPKESITTVRKKYSHQLFFEVAKIPLKEIKDL